MPRKVPAAWVVPRQLLSPPDSPPVKGSSVEPGTHESRIAASGVRTSVSTKPVDARSLARECLKEVGREMGVSM